MATVENQTNEGIVEDQSAPFVPLYLTSDPPKTFDPFLRLPPELRTQVWEASVPDARIIRLQHVDHIVRTATTTNLTNGIKAIDPNPGGLFACYESHQIYIKYYERSTFSSVEAIWFDFRRDELYLDYHFARDHPHSRGFRMSHLGSDVTRVARLAICNAEPGQEHDPRNMAVEDDELMFNVHVLRQFGSRVQRLSLVAESQRWLCLELVSAPFCDIDALISYYRYHQSELNISS